jgi:hypothetical protein
MSIKSLDTIPRMTYEIWDLSIKSLDTIPRITYEMWDMSIKSLDTIPRMTYEIWDMSIKSLDTVPPKLTESFPFNYMLKSKLSLSRHFEYANKQITYHFWLWWNWLKHYFWYSLEVRSRVGRLKVKSYNYNKLLTGATKLTSIRILLQECGWETLEERRNKHKILLFHKMGLHPHILE